MSEPSEAALRTVLENVRQRRTQGETQRLAVRLLPGTYHLSDTLRLDSTIVGEGLALHAADGTQVVFSGAQSLDPPTRDEQGNWRYPLPDGWKEHGVPRAMLVEQTLTTAARHPNEGYMRIEQALPDRRSGFAYQPDDLPETLPLDGHVCDLVLLHDWSTSRLPVASIDRSTSVLRTLGPIGSSAPHYAIDHFERQPRYFLEGHPAFADQPGEWYIDLATEKLVVIGQADAAGPPSVALPMLEQLFVATGDDDQPIANLVLHNITFTGTRFPMPPGGLACSQATAYEARDASGKLQENGRQMLSAAVHLSRAKDSVLRECKFHSLGNTALWIGSRTRDCRVENCHIDHVGGNGINLGEDSARRVEGRAWYDAAPNEVPTGNVVTGSKISHCGQILLGAVGIWGGFQQELQIVDNEVYDCPYTGVSLGWMWNPSPTPAGNNRIADNHIHHAMQILNDGGGIYTLGNQPNSVIEGNTITDIPINVGSAESNGMFLDEGTTGWTVRDNTFQRIARSPLRFHRAGQNTVTGNHWQLASPDTPAVRFNNTPEANITITNNVVIED
ncbi:right-handed parallel beta-helix repeat-containing protein [Aeoliella sp. ICT_H6.2]|uniref:Right-handed parallel beta-helix repeat-containing protein n=1 Tax=Aeoliella straminimaris TaxID=2954799 RepID=A0A9X2JIM7_9BACT|nr:right-handed parallel beta-helix repeat-containing protein [Aeoliella straminimaris]